MLAVESIKISADSVSFIKEKGCNYKILVFHSSIYNCKHVHIGIVALTNRVIYDGVIGHTHGITVMYISCAHM